MTRSIHWTFPWRLSLARSRVTRVSHARIHTLLLITLTCVGFALRLGLLTAFPLREDEAIYGYWARSVPSDPFFLHVWPDKPPLFIWLLSGSFALFGPSEATARLVSIFASTLTIPLAAVGAQRLWLSHRAALMAALLLTLNPYAVSFAPTAFTDSLLVLFGTGAVALALSGRGLGAGLLLGAVCMTKQQGLFYLPLVVALLLVDKSYGFHLNLPRSWELSGWLQGRWSAWRARIAALGWLLLGVALIVVPILLWDSQRWAVAPSPWDLAQQTYAPLHWLPPEQWLGRWFEWREWLWYLGGSWTVWAMLGVASALAVGMALHRPRVALLIGWGGAFMLMHLITSLQAWDRYLLPLAPWLAWVASGPLAHGLRAATSSRQRQVIALLVVLGLIGLIRPGLAAAQGQMPIGGDHGDYAGLTAAIASLDSILDGREGGDSLVLYHQALGWHFRFYLYDALQSRGDDPPPVDLRWFPSSAYLADNAAKTPYPPKVLIVPDWATPRDLPLHLALRGLTLEPRLHVGRFVVLEIIQPMRPVCNWCMSKAPSAPFFAPHEAILPLTPPMSTP
jgi:hypothetical protein